MKGAPTMATEKKMTATETELNRNGAEMEESTESEYEAEDRVEGKGVTLTL